MTGLWLRRLLFIALLLPAAQLFAHDARPVAVNIKETLPGIFQYSVHVPPTVTSDNIPKLVWPAACKPAAMQSAGADPDADGLMQCPDELSGAVFTVSFPLFNPSLATYYTLTRLDGTNATGMLPPTKKEWTVPARMTTVQVIMQYLVLGIEHILGGPDHLLFVLGLLVIARTMKRILWTISGFTIAHSITLTLAALGFVHVPVLPVEAAIAMSIVFLAHEISIHHTDSLTYRYPLIVSFGFGLLHGLGFASALGEIGLDPSQVVLSLLFFNVGVEVGQLTFISFVLFLLFVLMRYLHAHIRRYSMAAVARRVDILASYIIGIPACYWMIDRIDRFF